MPDAGHDAQRLTVWNGKRDCEDSDIDDELEKPRAQVRNLADRSEHRHGGEERKHGTRYAIRSLLTITGITNANRADHGHAAQGSLSPVAKKDPENRATEKDGQVHEFCSVGPAAPTLAREARYDAAACRDGTACAGHSLEGCKHAHSGG